MTSFNRRNLTLSCLEALSGQRDIDEIEITVFLVDDGSRDGTSEAVAQRFPAVRLLRGNGSLYWGGGTRMAFQSAIEEGFDAYLWLNDDSLLYENAVGKLVRVFKEINEAGLATIVVGSMCDPISGGQTYGGYQIRKSGLRIYFDKVTPDEVRTLKCNTMNGNFVLIPAAVVQKVGNIDEVFMHQRGDVDYGLRTQKLGFSIVLAPGYFGTCLDNSIKSTWRDRSQPLGKRWADLISPKGFAPREWILFTYRHFGWRWVFYAFTPYIRTILGTKC